MRRRWGAELTSQQEDSSSSVTDRPRASPVPVTHALLPSQGDFSGFDFSSIASRLCDLEQVEVWLGAEPCCGPLATAREVDTSHPSLAKAEVPTSRSASPPGWSAAAGGCEHSELLAPVSLLQCCLKLRVHKELA
ncbi:unnamed protein product [Rangifer tarandus platyrhynchus]|uniref:Uncharacterized protein n=1 Tax=Rangifer tarandus platyrhynchus TaxID=3082113 RepID=A0AC59YHC1_RANTA